MTNFIEHVPDYVWQICVKLVIVAGVFLAPLQSIILSLLFLISIDLVTGLWAAKKKKQQITSHRLSKTITKTFLYLFTVILTQVINNYLLFGSSVPLTSIVTTFIALTEFQSILENLHKIHKNHVLKMIITRLSEITKGRR